MFNFVVCEDNKIILQKNIDIVNKVMFNNNLSYRIYSFSKYDEELKKIISSSDDKKIYILDIELEDVSGIDIARDIRLHDLDSFIIISTAHTEYLPYTLKSKLLIFDFVSKFDNYEISLIQVIKRVLDSYSDTQKIFIKHGRNITEININEIISLEYDSNLRKTIIKTSNKDYIENKPLITFTKYLDDRFQKQKNGIILNTKYKSHIL